MFKHILVPLDGSPFAESAIPYACQLAQQFESELILVKVVEPIHLDLTGDAYDAALIEELRESAVRQASDYLDGKSGELRGQGYQVRRKVVHAHDIASTLLDVANNEEIDVIVISTHGRSGFSRWALGSVTERVLRHAPCPVLTIREDTSFEHILIALDGSQLAEAVIEPAIALAKQTGAKVTMLRVDDKPIDVDYETINRINHIEPGMADLLAHAEYNRAETYVEAVAHRYQDEAVEISWLGVTDHAANGILRIAQDRGCDVIALSTHGRTGLRRWVYGSVTEKVLRAASCSLLIVRP